MPKVPKLGQLPKHHAIHGTAEEKSERALRQAEDENREFYEEGARYAREVSLIQTGINERVARLLTRNFVDTSMEAGPVSPELAVVREERIKSELYRAVQGNELYETERGEDSKNYLGSVNVENMTSGRPRRMIEEMKNVAHGALKMVGGNNYVEAKLEKRFGKNEDLFKLRNATLAQSIDGALRSVEARDQAVWQNLKAYLKVDSVGAMREKLAGMSLSGLQSFDQWLVTAGAQTLYQNAAYRRMLTPVEHDLALGRRLYVAMRLRPMLERLAGNPNAQTQSMLEDLMRILNLQPDPNGDYQSQILDIVETMAGLRLSDLRAIRENPNLAPIANDAAFQDLALLVDVEQRESSKMGLDEIYDHQTLRKFWHDLYKAGGAKKDLANMVEDMLEQNSLFPLENNPEGKALLAEVRARLDYLDGNAEKLIAELKTIKEQELPTSELDEATKKKIDDARRELLEIADESRDQLGKIISARKEVFKLNAEIAKEEESLVKHVENLKKKLELDNQLFQDAVDKNNEAIKNASGSSLDDLSQNRDRLIEKISDSNSQFDQSKKKIEADTKLLQDELDKTNEAIKNIGSGDITELNRRKDELSKKIANNQSEIEKLQKKLERDNKLLQDSLDTINEAIKNAGKGVNMNRSNARLEQSRDNLLKEIAKNKSIIIDLESRGIYADVLDDRRKSLIELENKRVEANNKLEDVQDKARTVSRKIDGASAKKLVASHWSELKTTIEFLSNTDFLKVNGEDDFNRLNQLIAERRDKDNAIFNKLHGEIVEIKTTPFILLQRLMRRDYYKGRGLDVNVFNKKFNEEANHYALVKAGLRVQDVKNVDLIRSSNDKAAKYMKRGLHLRGWDRLTHAVAKGQNFLGLEPFEIENLSEDMLLKQIIDSEPEFAVFQGVNKFTTTRDLRDILHKTGQEVNPETLERFAAVLEEAVTKFKKVPPSLYKGLRMTDWDLENLILVLQKMKVELWSRKFLDKVEKSGGDGEREKILIGMLKQSRAEEQKIAASIAAEVKHPDAMWRKFLVKNELKKMLDQRAMEGMNKVRLAGVEQRMKQMQKLETEMAALPEGSPDKVRMGKEIENLKSEIEVVEKQIGDSKDLYEKVEAARAYIRDNNLSRKEKKEYLKEMGLTQVFDKMSTNFRMQRAWHYTKRAAAALWSGTKKTWAWSRKHIINMDKAKKAYSLGRLAATPVTWPLGMAWKVGTFPFRLTGRALVRATHMPKRFLGIFSKSMMRSYLRDRIINLEEKIDAISVKQSKLQTKLGKVPYSWDKRRIKRQINKLEEDKIKLAEDLSEYKKMAVDKKVDLGQLAIYQESANDNSDESKKAA